MSQNSPSTNFAPDQFDIKTLDDEIRVDQLCQEFLKLFYCDLVERQALSPEAASALAYGADYFLREFVIPDRLENLFALRPGRVRQFAGNWYIVRTLEPNMVELGSILKGVDAFYDFCLRQTKVTPLLRDQIRQETTELSFYESRIKAFWEISGDGFSAWDQACPLRD